eukprot:28466-Lingulodinium_polyedra.AAC.1
MPGLKPVGPAAGVRKPDGPAAGAVITASRNAVHLPRRRSGGFHAEAPSPFCGRNARVCDAWGRCPPCAALVG